MNAPTTKPTPPAAAPARQAQAPRAQAAKAAAPAPKAPTVMMWCPDGDCQIGLTSGHTIVVPGDPAGREIPRMFRREAIARGCIPVGMAKEDLDGGAGEGFDRAAHIKGKMKAMLESDSPEMFGDDGKPALNKLSELAGFTVERAERDALWTEFADELGDTK